MVKNVCVVFTYPHECNEFSFFELRFARICHFIHMPVAHKAVMRAVEIRAKQIFTKACESISMGLYLYVCMCSKQSKVKQAYQNCTYGYVNMYIYALHSITGFVRAQRCVRCKS